MIRHVENGVQLHLHQDELFALWLARSFGQKTYRGIGTAPLEFNKRAEFFSKAEWYAAHKLCLGGGNDVDEHISGKRARIKDKCAATIMAYENLKLEDPILTDQLDETLRFDQDKDCPKTHFGSWFKMVAMNMPGFEQRTTDYALQMFTALYQMRSNSTGPVPSELPFHAMAREWMKKKYPPKKYPPKGYEGDYRQWAKDHGVTHLDIRIRDHLIAIIDKEMVVNSKWAFSLSSVVQALWRTSFKDEKETRKDVTNFVEFFMTVLETDQRNFQTFLLEFRKDEDTFFRIKVTSQDGTRSQFIKAAIVKSDNPQAHTVLRYLGNIITIVINGKDNVTMQGDQDEAEKLGITDALIEGVTDWTGMCRYADMSPKDREGMTWATFRMRGHCPKDPYWYLPEEEWLSAYNATHNHEAPPTKRTREELKAYATNAFDRNRLNKWFAAMNVSMEILFISEQEKQILSLERAFDRGAAA